MLECRNLSKTYCKGNSEEIDVLSNLNLKIGAMEADHMLSDADLSLGMNKYGIYTMKHKDKYFAFQRDKKIGGPFDDLKDVEDFYSNYYRSESFSDNFKIITPEQLFKNHKKVP